MIIDWLAAGLNPASATIFIQSKILEHAELHVLLSMVTPVSWLERVPTYKDQQEKLKERDLATYGFLGYPLLQAADILIYRPAFVPVGEDQVAHVEMTREIARRFNHLFGREADFEAKSEKAIAKLGARKGKAYRKMRRTYQERGDVAALEEGRALIEGNPNLTVADYERLLGYLEGSGRSILIEPDALLTPTPKVPGLDGQKMSKSYGNTIGIREDPDSISKKVKTMQTDPARVRRTDPGDPDKCPVWDLHKLYTDQATHEWVQEGCRTAAIGCIDCKSRMLDAMLAHLDPIRARGLQLEQNLDYVRQVVADGNDDARDEARDTLEEVRAAIGIDY
jgi:tryptophanyl-tRNA synthetase